MNSGIMDAHNLAYRIAHGLESASLQQYSDERRHQVNKNITIANKLFQISIDIARTLGLDINNLNMFVNVMKRISKLPLA